MAIWQLSIILIPQKWAAENKYDPSLLYSEDGYDTETAWKENQPQNDFVDIISKMLPPAKSWSNDLLCWGDEKGHDIQVWSENDVIDGIHVRLAVTQAARRSCDFILTKLVTMSKELDCVLFYPELRLITEANEFELENAIRKSNAAKFAKDPKGFFKEGAEGSAETPK